MLIPSGRWDSPFPVSSGKENPPGAYPPVGPNPLMGGNPRGASTGSPSTIRAGGHPLCASEAAPLPPSAPRAIPRWGSGLAAPLGRFRRTLQLGFWSSLGSPGFRPAGQLLLSIPDGTSGCVCTPLACILSLRCREARPCVWHCECICTCVPYSRCMKQKSIMPGQHLWHGTCIFVPLDLTATALSESWERDVGNKTRPLVISGWKKRGAAGEGGGPHLVLAAGGERVPLRY